MCQFFNLPPPKCSGRLPELLAPALTFSTLSSLIAPECRPEPLTTNLIPPTRPGYRVENDLENSIVAPEIVNLSYFD